MTDAGFVEWAHRSTSAFADDQVAAGVLPRAEATAYAERALAGLLPHGPATPTHHLFTARDGSRAVVGSLWLRVRPLSTEIEATVLDLEVTEGLRGRGLGGAILAAGERVARSAGADVVRLNVFAHNEPARRLYASRGFRVARIALLWEPSGPGPTAPPDGPGEVPAAGAPVGLREPTAGEASDLARSVEADLAAGLVAADLLPDREAHEQAAAEAADWRRAVRAGVVLVAERAGQVIGAVRLEREPGGTRALLHLHPGAVPEGAAGPVPSWLHLVAAAVLRRGAVAVESTLSGAVELPPAGRETVPALPDLGPGEQVAYRVTAQTRVKRW